MQGNFLLYYTEKSQMYLARLGFCGPAIPQCSGYAQIPNTSGDIQTSKEFLTSNFNIMFLPNCRICTSNLEI